MTRPRHSPNVSAHHSRRCVKDSKRTHQPRRRYLIGGVGGSCHHPFVDWLAETRTSYDVVATDYEEFVRGSFDGLPVLRSVLMLFAELIRGDGPVLDLGCGPGQVTKVLYELGLDMVGIDLSPAMFEIARHD
jgi:SAM-dependent methyltransferase